MFNFILNIVFSFGDNYFEGDDGVFLPTFLSFLSGVLIAIITVWLTLRQQKRFEARKEAERLKDVRVQWYLALRHLKRGIKSQTEAIDKIIAKVNDDLALEPPRVFQHNLTMITNIYPSAAKKLNSNDLFTIFITTKADNKLERQRLFNTYTSAIHLIEEAYKDLKFENKRKVIAHNKIQKEFQDMTNSLINEMQRFWFAETKRTSITDPSLFPNDYYKGLFGIFINFKSKKERELLDVIKLLVQPIQDFSFTPKCFGVSEAETMLTLAKDIENTYYEFVGLIHSQLNALKLVRNSIERAENKVFSKILDIEFADLEAERRREEGKALIMHPINEENRIKSYVIVE